MRFIPYFWIIALLSLPASGQTATLAPSAEGMSLIPGAAFEMGLDATEIPRLQERFKISRAEIFAEATPKHRVTVAPFYIDRTEVTNGQFKRFVEQDPEWRKDRIAAEYHNGKYLQEWNANNFLAGKEDLPVVFVSWYAAAAFCRAQGKRLPTEAEWEYAARGGLSEKAFPWGDEIPDKTRANYGESGLGSPAKVGSYPPNGYGLYDMAGNVWEFLADEWGRYPAEGQTDASGMFKDNSFLAVRSRRALRGGSYGGAPVNLMVTYRDSHSPENAAGHVGFRCAMDAPARP